MKEAKHIAWWSGGVTSAVTCWYMIKLFGLENVRVIFIDTRNEDDDTYRFKLDCEKWYGCCIETIASTEYESIEDVWYKHLSLNVATGAICSTKLKREVREDWQKHNEWLSQAFGFDLKEAKRALSMSLNYPTVKAVYPLMYYGLLKKDCAKIVQDVGIELPRMYQLGFQNNNCFKTGCVQGGIGYWQLMRELFPDKFFAMAKREHELTNLKGEPVTICKDQSKDAVKIGSYAPVFLMPHPDYLEVKDISMMKGRQPEPIIECNGFCGLNDLISQDEKQYELNFF